VLITVDGLGDLDAFLEVFDGERSLARDDDTNGRDPELQLVLEEGRSYRVRVRPFSRGEGGRYTIEVASIAPAPPPVTGVPQGAGILDGGRLVRGEPLSLSVGAGQVVRFAFVGSGGETVFEVVGLAGFDPTLTVLDQAGAEIGFDDDSLGNSGSQLALTLGEGQAVTLEVAEFGNDEAGAFTIQAR
ncbi:MAG: hypothetical protein M3527_08620, partial [Actinomycetota bacterium]|nr:hypothetical protein [Actinomycetota bacterium]